MRTFNDTRHTREELLQEALDMHAVTHDRLAELQEAVREKDDRTRREADDLLTDAIVAMHRAMTATQDAEALIRSAVLDARGPIRELERLLGVPAMEDEE